MTQTKPIFRAVGLGGMGHVGGNLFVYETPEDIIAVDCGVLFADEGFPGIDKLIPDIGYLNLKISINSEVMRLPTARRPYWRSAPRDPPITGPYFWDQVHQSGCLRLNSPTTHI